MEQSPYMESVTADRALLLTEEQALEGNILISLEAQADLVEDNIVTYITGNFAQFLTALRSLKAEDQDLLLSYYLTGNTQSTLAQLHHTTQTVCSFRLRMAVKALGTYLMMGQPSEETLRELFSRTGFEDSLHTQDEAMAVVPLSKVCLEYAQLQNFQTVATLYKLHRPDVRRAMSRASKALKDSTEPQEAAVAAWIHSMIDKASPTGTGVSKRKAATQGNMYLHDPVILGDFRVKIDDPGFGALFVSRANN